MGNSSAKSKQADKRENCVQTPNDMGILNKLGVAFPRRRNQVPSTKKVAREMRNFTKSPKNCKENLHYKKNLGFQMLNLPLQTSRQHDRVFEIG